MDELIKKFVSRKIRKQGKQYNLSANSVLSCQDFSYANKIASKIYALSKSILPNIGDHSLFRKLLSQVSVLQRADELHELGQLRIGYGNSQTLRGFQFNPRQSWAGFVPWLTEVVCSTTESIVQITIPSEKNWSMKRYANRVSRLGVRYHVFKIPFELTEEVASWSTKELLFKPGQQSALKKASFSIAGWDDCLILVVGSIRAYLWDTHGEADFMTDNKSFMAAGILEVFCLREGQLIQDRVVGKAKTSQPTPDEGVDWE